MTEPVPLPLLHSGKVREMYEVDDRHLLMVASDRISAFDVVFDRAIPDKGRVLTALTMFWARTLATVAPTHLDGVDPSVLDATGAAAAPELAGRALLVRRAEMLPLECIVRGYITGSAWKEYQAGGTMHGAALPAGLRESDQLPEPVFTPSTKAPIGEHDENIGFDDAVDLVGRDLAERARQLCLAAYAAAAAHARERGIIVADTKFEVGLVDGTLVIADELLTPDSSRFWPVDGWRPGQHASVARQAADPRLVGGHRMGQAATGAAAARRGRGRHPAALRRRLRAPQRPVVPAVPRRCGVRFAVRVEVMALDDIADPQGSTIERALPALGFAGVSSVRVGKSIRFVVDSPSAEAAEAEVRSMCERLLANPVIERSDVEVVPL